jgi:hypothetical protein
VLFAFLKLGCAYYCRAILQRTKNIVRPISQTAKIMAPWPPEKIKCWEFSNISFEKSGMIEENSAIRASRAGVD